MYLGKKKDKKLMDIISTVIEQYLDDAVEKYIDEHIDELRARILDKADVDGSSQCLGDSGQWIEASKAAEERAEADNKIAELEEQLRAVKAKNERLEGVNRELEKTKQNLQTELGQEQAAHQRDNDSRDAAYRGIKQAKEKLESERNDLCNEKHNLIVEKDGLQEDKKKLQSDYDSLKIELGKAKNTLEQTESELSYYKQSYSSIEEIYKLYQSLDEDTKTGLRGVFHDAVSPLDFFCGAVQAEHLSGLWYYLKNRFNSGLSKAQQEDFNKLFDFCFEMANKDEPQYLRLQADTDVEFNSEEMIRTSDSNQLGEVKEVLFIGYRNIDGIVVKKNLVRLG